MSTYSMAVPHSGHLQQLYYRMFGYLKLYPNRTEIALDPQHPAINERTFKKCDWTEFYQDVTKATPRDMPLRRGNPISTRIVSLMRALDVIVLRVA